MVASAAVGGKLLVDRLRHSARFAERVLEDTDAWKVVELAPEPAAVLSPAAVSVKA